MTLDVSRIRQQFPTLTKALGDVPLAYLDSAATALMPDAALQAMTDFEATSRSNVHRGLHPLADKATEAYEGARKTVADLVGASADEIVFTKNCTEAMNIAIHGWGRTHLQAGDLVLLSRLEHHSAVVPWLQLKKAIGIEIEWIELTDDGDIDQEQYRHLLEKKPKAVTITGQSNVLGTRPPLADMISDAHKVGAVTFVDATQLIVHHAVDVTELDCDFLAFSGHKLYGPTGIGVLYGKRSMLKNLPPLLGGGMMIHEVKDDSFTSADPPHRFEAGTPPITQAVGLAAAINWLQQYDWGDIEVHEKAIAEYATGKLTDIDGVKILGSTDTPGTCISFTVDGLHPHDLADLLGQQGACLRAGHHCCEPLHRNLNVPATLRLSVGIYTNTDDIDVCIEALTKAISTLIH